MRKEIYLNFAIDQFHKSFMEQPFRTSQYHRVLEGYSMTMSKYRKNRLRCYNFGKQNPNNVNDARKP